VMWINYFIASFLLCAVLAEQTQTCNVGVRETRKEEVLIKGKALSAMVSHKVYELYVNIRKALSRFSCFIKVVLVHNFTFFAFRLLLRLSAFIVSAETKKFISHREPASQPAPAAGAT